MDIDNIAGGIIKNQLTEKFIDQLVASNNIESAINLYLGKLAEKKDLSQVSNKELFDEVCLAENIVDEGEKKIMAAAIAFSPVVKEKIVEMNNGEDVDGLEMGILEDIFSDEKLTEEDIVKLRESLEQFSISAAEKEKPFNKMILSTINVIQQADEIEEDKFLPLILDVESDAKDDNNPERKLEMTARKCSYTFTINNHKADLSSMYDYFNSLSCSVSVPFIKYVNGGNSFFKAYNKLDVYPNFSTLNSDNHIYLGIYHSPTLKHSTIAKLNFTTSTLTMEYSLIHEDFILRQLQIFKIALSAMNLLEFKGELSIPVSKDVKLDGGILADIITNSAFSNIFFINETYRPLEMKKKFSVGCHKLLSHVYQDREIVGGSFSNTADINFTLWLKGSEDEEVDEDEEILKVEITKGRDIELLEEFYQLLRALLVFYEKERDVIRQQYSRFASEFKMALPVMAFNYRKAKETVRGSKFDNTLRLALRKVFSNSSAIPDENLPEYLGEDGEYNVSPFKGGEKIVGIPRYNEKYFFTCPPGKYMSFMKNTGKNKEEFPYLPICVDNKDDVVKMGEDGEVEKKVVDKINIKRVINSYQELNEGYKGKVPESLAKYFSTYLNFDDPVYRYGAVDIGNINSFFHAINLAVKGNKLSDAELARLRSRIASANPAIFLQDIPVGFSVKSEMSKPDSYINPLYIYRAMEEIYNINIYFIDTSEKVFIWKNDYAKTYIDRECVIVMYNPGKTEKLSYRHCELVVLADKLGEVKNYIFSKSTSKKIYDTIGELYKTISVYPQGKGISVFSNLSMNMDYRKFASAISATSQIVNHRGKCTALVSTSKRVWYTQHTDTYANLPLADEKAVEGISNDSKENIQREIDIIASKGKGKIVKTSQTNAGNWYGDAGINYAYFAKFSASSPSVESSAGDKEGITPLSASSSISSVKLYNKTKQNASVIVQLIRWLFNYSSIIPPSGRGDEKEIPLIIGDAEKFISQNVVVDEKVSYDFSLLELKLPIAADYSAAVAHVKKIVPQLISADGKIVLTSKRMLDGIITDLREYGMITDPAVIPKKYLYNYDRLIPHKYTSIFRSQAAFVRWINNRNLSQDIKTVNKLKLEDAFTIEPFIYISKGKDIKTEDTYFIIQNVREEGEAGLNKCGELARYWDKYSINKANTLPNEGEGKSKKLVNNYILYSINDQGSLFVVENKKTPGIKHANILVYKIRVKLTKYAVILPIL